MKEQYPIALIFSVFKPSADNLTNLSKHYRAMVDLKVKGIPFKIVEGQYKGNSERSFIVFGNRGVELGKRIALDANQESVLFLNQDRDAILIECKTGIETALGKFKAVPEHVAKQSTGWTFDNTTNRFFICE